MSKFLSEKKSQQVLRISDPSGLMNFIFALFLFPDVSTDGRTASRLKLMSNHRAGDSSWVNTQQQQ